MLEYAFLSVLVSVTAILLYRDRRQFALSGVCIAAGIAIGLEPWLFGYYTKFWGFYLQIGNGIIALYFVLLIWLFARAHDHRIRSHKAAGATDTSTQSDGACAAEGPDHVTV